MTRRVSAIVLIAVLAACGGRGTGEQTTPEVGGKDPGVMQDRDPGAIPPGEPGAGEVADHRHPDRDPGLPEEDAEPDETAPPAIEPPDLDIGSAEQERQVAEHLRRARAALSGPGKDADEAIERARAALAVDATNVDAVVLLAHAYYIKRLYDTAEVVLDMMYNERRERASGNAGVYYVYGLIYDRTDRPTRAREAYERAVALDPNHRSALMNLGVHYLRNERDAEAVQLYERLTGQLGVNTAAAWNNLGSAYRRRSGEYSADRARRDQFLRAAGTAFRRAIQVDKNYAPTYYNVGLLYLDSDEFPGADGRPMDLLARLQRARTYFDEYRRLPGADQDLVDERLRLVNRLITREERRRKAASQE